MKIELIILVLGAVLTVEGAILLASPGYIKDMMKELIKIPDRTLRIAALIFTVTGLLIIYLLRNELCK